MQIDFHYYATYCAAILAGYDHDESLTIAYSDQLVDCCTRTLLGKIGGPRQAATTQSQAELMDASTDPVGLQDITRIWASFHFIPGDLKAVPDMKCSKAFLRKYRLICQPNSELAVNTVELARDKSLQAAGLAMHVVADTWAHRYFAGTPSLVINNVDDHFYEIVPIAEADAQTKAINAQSNVAEAQSTVANAQSNTADAQSNTANAQSNAVDAQSYQAQAGFIERKIDFNHNPASPDDPEKGIYTNSLYQGSESSIMNLGHGRAGHLPDYSWARYRYMPSWGGYKEIIKDNPDDYLRAFCQVIYALRCLKDGTPFEADHYDAEAIEPLKYEIREILLKRQMDSSEDWKRLGEKLSGNEIEDFDIEKYQREYADADPGSKDDTFLGRFILAALSQKSMVTNRIFVSGNYLAGISVDFDKKGFRGLRDFRRLVEESARADRQ